MDTVNFKRGDILKRIGRMEQAASIRRYAIEDGKGRGMRAFEVTNSSGFDFTVYPDRGLDIGPARYQGKSLVWLNRNGEVHPAFYDRSGVEWLRTWMGGLVTTCGWLNVGNPCVTADGEHGIHGRMDHIPAEEVNTRSYWKTPEAYFLEITGKIVHSRVFGENLVTTRTITTRLGFPGFELCDRTENIGSSTMPLMQMYHMNFGWPLVGESMRLEAPSHKVFARDKAAEAGLNDWEVFPAPDRGYAEQVLIHDQPADDDGFCTMKIVNPDFGPAVSLSYRKVELPYLNQWRMAGEGDYVLGLEPGNCYPVGQADFAKTGLLRRIEPGQCVETVVRLAVEGCGA